MNHKSSTSSAEVAACATVRPKRGRNGSLRRSDERYLCLSADRAILLEFATAEIEALARRLSTTEAPSDLIFVQTFARRIVELNGAVMNAIWDHSANIDELAHAVGLAHVIALDVH